MRILLIEDDERIARFIERGLKAEGHQIHRLKDGQYGLETVKSSEPDLLILDRMLPHVDGLTLCQQIRATGNQVLILMLSALGEVEERIQGLRTGADDYLAKPFHFEELLARIEALQRRNIQTHTSNKLRFADLELCLSTMRVYRDEQPIELTAKEISILELFLRKPGHIFSRERILANVWGIHQDPLTNVVDVYMRRLRKKIDMPFAQPLIQTKRGMGYYLGDA
ncbi:TPA: response regulator transcription factor [Vibrio cholerae]|uniref:response regulator transcription factor n=1 Tax=Vibrio cholerae TaxID=666 RepID=UPI000BA981DC|nr:response regulator transcription factor [Vibrio cholerae]EJL6462732.1 response regulator transcription factor [Vibrio cholerae]EJL6627666.1 response regulator transcription factor [Vibrio cholerae]EJL6741125.1 response regulator transcription factor [Vibrio cholerae]EJL6780244.1 response regulator transcription factor [Vibrio cholerae]EKF9985023.1 response regulator transcription factor [Vibrio cholerae]